MSKPVKSAAKHWRLLSYRNDTPLERAFVEGILHTLAELTDPCYTLGLPTAAEVEEIARQVDQRRARRDAECELAEGDQEPSYAEKVNAPLSPEVIEALRQELASGSPARYRKSR